MRRALIPALAVTSACALLTSFDGFDQPKERAPDAATDADTGELDAGACAHKRWPSPSARGGGGDLGVQYAAVKMMSFGPDAGPTPGFDLDNLCTCPERQGCVGNRPGEPCDPANGADNTASALFGDIAQLLPSGSLDESGLRSALENGRFGVVFRISGWNGEPDDDDLALALFNAFDLDPSDAGAKFDGTDRWVLDQASFVGTVPLFAAEKAYVAGGVLVARFPFLVVKARVPTSGKRWALLPITFRDAQLTARISRSGSSFSLAAGEIGGRLPMSAIFEVAASVGACLDPSDTLAKQISENLCFRRDIMLDPAKDGLDERCDAISAGIAFEATPAGIAADSGTPQEYIPCPDAGRTSCE